MAISNALREIWSRRINSVMRTSVMLDSPTFVNYDYERDATNANKVRMLTFNDIGAGTYDPTGAYSTSNDIRPNAVADRKVELPLDQFPYVIWAIENAHELQIDLNVRNGTIQNAGEVLAREREKFIAKKMATGISNTNDVFEHGTADEGFALKDEAANGGQALFKAAVRNAAIRLDGYGVPMQGRFLLVPPVFRHFATDQFNLSTESREQRIAEGWMGELYGFNIYMNHYLHDTPTSGQTTAGEETWCIAGHPSLFTFADQLKGVDFSVHEMEMRVRAYRIIASSQYGAAYKKNCTTDGENTAVEGACKIKVDTVNDTQVTT